MKNISFSLTALTALAFAGGANSNLANELPIGKVVLEKINHDNGGGVDWYKFSTEKRGKVSIYLTPKSPFSLRAYVVDNLIGSDGLGNSVENRSGYRGEPVNFYPILDKGTHYLAIKTEQDSDGVLRVIVLPSYHDELSSSTQPMPTNTKQNTEIAPNIPCEPQTVIVQTEDGERVKKLEDELKFQSKISHLFSSYLQKLYFMLGASTDGKPDESQKDAIIKLQAMQNEIKELKDIKGSFKDYKKKTVGE
jgi:hypothetical protein